MRWLTYIWAIPELRHKKLRTVYECTVLHFCEEMSLDTLVEKLDARLRVWKPETAAQVRERVAEVIELADCDILDLLRSRSAEQEVLDLLDDPRRLIVGMQG